MKFDDPERSLQNRTVSWSNLPGPDGGTIAFYAHGVTGDETRKRKARRFFEMVDNGLAGNFSNRETPLLLLGPDDEVGLYRQVNHYPHLCEDDLRFSASNLSGDRLEAMICEWIANRENAQKMERVTDLRDALGQGPASNDLGEVLKAALDGRIASLFLREGETRYGVGHRNADCVELHEARKAGDDELLDLAATSVATTSGEVRFVGGNGDLGGDSPVAAVMRY